MNPSREQRRQLERDNRRFPVTLERVPESEWKHLMRDRQIEVWRSRGFLVQVFRERPDLVRLTVCRTTHDGGSWNEGITWDELQRLKRECGRGNLDAVEVFPADTDLVNVANMRHLWVFDGPLDFAWRRKPAPPSTEPGTR